MTQTHVMVDLETWGTVPGCDIRSIGAVVFDPVAGTLGDEFYVNSVNRYWDDGGYCASGGWMKHPLTCDPSTVEWWSQQSEAAQARLTVDQYDIRHALARFADWWAEHQPEGEVTTFWAHGPHFDEAILAACYRAVGQPVPWHYRAPRDCRTVWDLAGGIDLPFEGVEHDALADAKHQARCVIEAYRRIRCPIGRPRRYEVWQEPVNGQTLHKLKRLGTYSDHEAASEDRYFALCDDPAPDKHEFYRVVVRSVFE